MLQAMDTSTGWIRTQREDRLIPPKTQIKTDKWWKMAFKEHRAEMGISYNSRAGGAGKREAAAPQVRDWSSPASICLVVRGLIKSIEGMGASCKGQD